MKNKTQKIVQWWTHSIIAYEPTEEELNSVFNPFDLERKIK